LPISILDVEVLNGGKGVQRGIADLLDGRKLPIRFSARDTYPKIFLVRLRCPVSKFDAGGAIIELHTCIIECPESWCTIDELGESWAVKIDLIEENYIHFVELRGVDAGHESL
jgi:hypothetical protein